jgi:AcrR family transcriptional regulator
MENTAERIVGKAYELFMRYGIRSVSMDEIANQLGMSKKTIYQYYADKDELVEDAIEIVLNINRTDSARQLADSENAVHEVFLSLDTVKQILNKMNPAVIFDLEKYHTGAFNKYNDHKNRFLFNVIVTNLNRGKDEGLYRKEINVNLIARFRLASMFLIFNPEIFPGEQFNLPQLLAETTDNFLYGIANERGQQLIEHYKQQSKNLITA